ncbi:MAG: putative collagen-binding domain-containing protein [Isosphaeraceae bacterium]
MILKLLETVPWTRLVPDAGHRFLTAGYGEWKQADSATAAVATDGSCGLAYLPGPRAVTLDLSLLSGPAKAEWFDPTSGQSREAPSREVAAGKAEFMPPDRNAAGEPDWILVLTVA